MIKIDKLTDKDIGRHVVYKDGVGEREFGYIKSWNDKYIFVVFKCDGDWDNYQMYTGAATHPNDLRFVKTRPGEEDINSRFDILDIRE